MRIRPGDPYPLGATWDGLGVNFALYSENASSVELCLFDSADAANEAAGDPRYSMDYTGCGNTLKMRNPAVLRLIMDSLRYWVADMRVDGFRFDLASALARELHEVDKFPSSTTRSSGCSTRSFCSGR